MKLAKMKKVAVIFASTFVILSGIGMGLSLVFQESPKAREQKKSEVCYVSLQMIGVAMQKYLEQDGAFPPNLETLLELDYLKSPQMISCGGEKYHYVAGMAKGMPGNIPLIIEKNAPHIFQYPNGSTVDYGRVLYLDMSLQPLSRGSLKRCCVQSRRALTVINDAGKNEIEAMLTNPNRYTFMEQACALWKWQQQPELLPPKLLDGYLEDFLIRGHIFDCKNVSRELNDKKIPRELRLMFSRMGILLSITASVKIKQKNKKWAISDPNSRRIFNIVRIGEKLKCYTQIVDPNPTHKYGNYLDNPRPALRQALYLRQMLRGDLRDIASNPNGEKRDLWLFYSQELTHPDYATRKNTWKMLFPKCKSFPMETMYPKLSATRLATIVNGLHSAPYK